MRVTILLQRGAVSALACTFLWVSDVSAAPPAAALAAPAAEHIPAEQLGAAIEQAVASGVASILARVLAEDNELRLAYPPVVSLKRIGTKDLPARKVVIESPIYKDEYKEVEQLVPEFSAGQPTGGFVRAKVKVLAKRTLIDTKTTDHWVPDPKGTEIKPFSDWAPSGPALYEPNTLAFNGMALHVLAKAGHAGHPAAEEFATSLADTVSTLGLPDNTFDLAWLAAGFVALGPDSPHARLARSLVSKLIDGQIREKGAPRGLWGPVCIHYPYFLRLFESYGVLYTELKVNMPKRLEMAAPQQQPALIKQAQEMKKAESELKQAYIQTSLQTSRMREITLPYLMAGEQTVISGLPLYVYNRVVADVESTAAAAFALAEAERQGMLPAETSRFAVRGKKVLPPEKTAVAVKLAAERLAAAIGEDGDCPGLTVEAINSAFDRSSFGVSDVPYTGTFPPLIDIETAVSSASGHAGLAWLAQAAPEVRKAKAFDAALGRARGRTAALAERWYAESAKGFSPEWPSVYKTFTVSHADLTKSPTLSLPRRTKTTVDKLPWGRPTANYEALTAFCGLFAGTDGAKLLDDDLYRRLAYRVVSLQDPSGQWLGVTRDLFSSAKDALSINEVAAAWHQTLTLKRELKLPDPVPFELMRRPQWSHPHARFPARGVMHTDRCGYPTLASLVFLVQAVDGPVSLDGVTIVPEPAADQAATDQPAAADDGEPKRMTPLDAAGKASRPNPARATLFDAVLASQRIPIAEVPVAKPAAPQAETKPAAGDPPAAEPEDPNIGKVEDLFKPASP